MLYYHWQQLEDGGPSPSGDNAFKFIRFGVAYQNYESQTGLLHRRRPVSSVGSSCLHQCATCDIDARRSTPHSCIPVPCQWIHHVGPSVNHVRRNNTNGTVTQQIAYWCPSWEILVDRHSIPLFGPSPDHRRGAQFKVSLCITVRLGARGRPCQKFLQSWRVPSSFKCIIGPYNPLENSDFLTIHNAFASWRRASANPGFVRKFCRVNFLSHQVSQMHTLLDSHTWRYLVL